MTQCSKRSAEPPAPPRRIMLLALVACDNTFVPCAQDRVGTAGQGWLGKCIHCKAALWVSQ